jgi:hypothetical protein
VSVTSDALDQVGAAYAAGDYSTAAHLVSLYSISEQQARDRFGLDDAAVAKVKSQGIWFPMGAEGISGTNVPSIPQPVYQAARTPTIAPISNMAAHPGVPSAPGLPGPRMYAGGSNLFSEASNQARAALPPGLGNHLPALAIGAALLLFVLRHHKG